MQPPAEPQRAATTLLTIHAGGTSWAIPSAAVARIQRLSPTASPPELDVLSLLGVEVVDPELTPRVMVLRDGREQVEVLARGALALTEAGARDLLALPAELSASAPLVSHIAVIDGKPALFVLSPERLLHAARAGSAARTPPHDPASR